MKYMGLSLLIGLASCASIGPHEMEGDRISVSQLLQNQVLYIDKKIAISGYLCWFDIELGTYGLFQNKEDCESRQFDRSIIILFPKIPREIGYYSGTAKIEVVGVYHCGGGACATNSLIGSGYIEPDKFRITEVSSGGPALPPAVLSGNR